MFLPDEQRTHKSYRRRSVRRKKTQRSLRTQRKGPATSYRSSLRSQRSLRFNSSLNR